MTLSKSVTAWKARQPNGQIPLKELQEVPGTYDVDLKGPCRFMPEASRSFERMRADMFADIGVKLSPSRTYRPLAIQKAKYADYLARGRKPPIVAQPGTSNHGEALAGDMGFATFTDRRYVWLKKHGGKYGWHQNDAPSEPWHWDYEGDYDRRRFDFETEEDEDVSLEKYVDGQERYRKKFKELGKDPGPPPAHLDRFQKAGWASERFGAIHPKSA